jgi:Short C-terminal domain
MGLMFRRRRPVMRMAAGAATAGVAYHAGAAHAASGQDAEMAQQAPPDAPPQYAPPPPAPSAPAPAAAADGDPAASIEQLAALHNSGALTDEEFAAAKAKILGI